MSVPVFYYWEIISWKYIEKNKCHVSYNDLLTYLLQVGHWQSGSIGWRSLAYCLCFTWRDPQGTKAEPNLWGKRNIMTVVINSWYGVITATRPFKSDYERVCGAESLLQFGWGTRSQTYRIPKQHTPPNPQHTCRTWGSHMLLCQFIKP